MRQRLLDATVECLVERGWSGTSTTLVSERAGVSRGAQLHHFPTKNDLVVAAVEHLSEQRGEELQRAADGLPRGRDAPERSCRCSASTSPPGVQRRARAVGGGPQRRRAARRRGAVRAGSAGRPTG